MRHPEVLLVPILLLSDYYLTLAGAKLAGERYHRHFRLDHYELNPVWQESIAKRRWFNPRHLLLVVLVSAVFFFMASDPEFPDELLSGLIGVYFGAHGTVIGKHLSNLLMFRRVKNRPEEIRGEVFMAHSLILAISQAQYISILVPLLLLAGMTRNPMVVGAACGAGLLIAVHGIWRARARRVAQRAKPVAVPEVRESGPSSPQ